MLKSSFSHFELHGEVSFPLSDRLSYSISDWEDPCEPASMLYSSHSTREVGLRFSFFLNVADPFRLQRLATDPFEIYRMLLMSLSLACEFLPNSKGVFLRVDLVENAGVPRTLSDSLAALRCSLNLLFIILGVPWQ